MATTDLPIPGAEEPSAEEVVARTARGTVEGPSVTASMCAIGTANTEKLSAAACAIATAKTENLEATASAVLLTQADGDVNISLSASPIVYAKGNATFRQAYASAFVSGGDVSISQGGAPVIVGREITIDSGGGAALIAGEATVRHGFIGLLFARNADVAEDTKVFLDTRGALILAAVLLGGFGIVAVAMYLGAKRISEWRPTFPAMKRLR